MASKTGGVGRATVTKAKTGKPVANPATMNAGEKYSYSTAQGIINGTNPISNIAGKAFSAIGSAISKVASWIPKGAIGGNN